MITFRPRVVKPDGSYRLEGIRLDGMSPGSAFGDELQDATHYPLVRTTHLVNAACGLQSRTHDHSSMAVTSERVS